MSHQDDIRIAHEMRWVHCPDCGGGLLLLEGQAWCDWCEASVRPELDGECVAQGSDEVERLLEDLERERRQRGYRTRNARRGPRAS